MKSVRGGASATGSVVDHHHHHHSRRYGTDASHDTPRRSGSHSPGNASFASTVMPDVPAEYHDAAATHKFRARIHCTASSDTGIWTAEGEAVRIRHPASGEIVTQLPQVYSKPGVLVHTLLLVSQRHVWCGLDDGTIAVIDETSHKPVSEFRQHSGAVLCLAQGASGIHPVFSGGHDWKAYEWAPDPDAEGRITLRRMFYAHSNSVRCLAVCHPGFLVSGSSDCSLRVWEVLEQDPGGCEPDQSDSFAKLEGHKGAVRSVVSQLHPSGDTLLWSGDEGGSICLWGLGECVRQHGVSVGKGCTRARPLRVISEHRGAIPSLILYEGQIWSCGQDGQILSWRVEWPGGAAPPDVWVVRSLTTKGCLRGLQLCGRYTVQKMWSTCLDHSAKSDGTVVAWNIELPEVGSGEVAVPASGGYMQLEKIIKRLQAQNGEPQKAHTAEVAQLRKEVSRLEGVVKGLKQQQQQQQQQQQHHQPVGCSPKQIEELRRDNVALQNEVTRLTTAAAAAVPVTPPRQTVALEEYTSEVSHLESQLRATRDSLASSRAEVVNLKRQCDEAADARDSLIASDMQGVLERLEELRQENEWLQSNAKEVVEQKSRTCELLRLDIARLSNELTRAEDLAGAAEEASRHTGGLEEELAQRDSEVSQLQRLHRGTQAELAKALREASALRDEQQSQQGRSVMEESFQRENLALSATLDESREESQAQAKVIQSLNGILNERAKSIDLLKEVSDERARQIQALEGELRAAQAQRQRRAVGPGDLPVSPGGGGGGGGDRSILSERVERAQEELVEKRSQIDRLHMDLDAAYVDRDRLEELEVLNADLDAELRAAQEQIDALAVEADRAKGALEECAALRDKVAVAETDAQKLVVALDANPVAAEARRRVEELLEENAVLLTDNKTLAEQQEMLQVHVASLEESKSRAAEVQAEHSNYDMVMEERDALTLQVESLRERCVGLEANSMGQMSREDYDQLESRARELAMTVTLQKEAAEQSAQAADVLMDLLAAYEEELAALHSECESHERERASSPDDTRSEGSVVERLLRDSREKGAAIATMQVRNAALTKDLEARAVRCDELTRRSCDLQKRVSLLEGQLSDSSGSTDRAHLRGLSALCEAKNAFIASLLDEVHRRDNLLADAQAFMSRRSAAIAAAREPHHPAQQGGSMPHDTAAAELREEARALRVQLHRALAKPAPPAGGGSHDADLGDKVDKLVAELEKREHLLSQKDALLDALQRKVVAAQLGGGEAQQAERVCAEAGCRDAQRQLGVKARHLDYALRRCEQLAMLVNADPRDNEGHRAREQDLVATLREMESRLREKDVVVSNLQHAQEIASDELAAVQAEAESIRETADDEQRKRHGVEHEMISLTDMLKDAKMNIDALRQQLDEQEGQAASDGDGATAAQLREDNKELLERLQDEVDTSNTLHVSLQNLKAEQASLHEALLEAQGDRDDSSNEPDAVEVLSERLIRELQSELNEREETISVMKGDIFDLQTDRDALQDRIDLLQQQQQQQPHYPPHNATPEHHHHHDPAQPADASDTHRLREENARLRSDLDVLLAASQQVHADTTDAPAVARLEAERASQDTLLAELKEETRDVWTCLSDTLRTHGDEEIPESLLSMAEAVQRHVAEGFRHAQDADEAESALQDMQGEAQEAWDSLESLFRNHAPPDMQVQRQGTLVGMTTAVSHMVSEAAEELRQSLQGDGGRSPPPPQPLSDLIREASAALLQTNTKRDDMVESVRTLADTAGVQCSLRHATPDELLPVLDACGGALLNLREEHDESCAASRTLEEALLREKDRRRGMLEEVQTLKMDAEEMTRRIAGLTATCESHLGGVLEWGARLAGRTPQAAEAVGRICDAVAESRSAILGLAAKALGGGGGGGGGAAVPSDTPTRSGSAARGGAGVRSPGRSGGGGGGGGGGGSPKGFRSIRTQSPSRTPSYGSTPIHLPQPVPSKKKKSKVSSSGGERREKGGERDREVVRRQKADVSGGGGGGSSSAVKGRRDRRSRDASGDLDDVSYASERGASNTPLWMSTPRRK